MTVHEYIGKNWSSTIKEPEVCRNTPFRMPKPYTTPCASELFVNFFYWDTYFTNLGLRLAGRQEQVKNNLEVMKFFVQFLGYVPNADHLITRTQPPLFARSVYDCYQECQDVGIIEAFIDAVLRELHFFETDRMTVCGLNGYGNQETRDGKLWYYEEFDRRLHFTEEERKLDPYALADGLLAIAESGWDFNPRFMVEGNRFAANLFAHLDLNCILYDAERKAAEMLVIAGRQQESGELLQKAEHRKLLINQYMMDPETGIYYDYHVEKGVLSGVLSAASLYPYALGISRDGEGAAAVLKRLKLPGGISACEYRGREAVYFQWDYPNMWPSNAYFAYLAAKNTGLSSWAAAIKGMYLSTVEEVFERTGKLWEKYDALQKGVSETPEYPTPEMMGWTAGVYEYFYQEEAEN